MLPFGSLRDLLFLDLFFLLLDLGLLLLDRQLLLFELFSGVDQALLFTVHAFLDLGLLLHSRLLLLDAEVVHFGHEVLRLLSRGLYVVLGLLGGRRLDPSRHFLGLFGSSFGLFDNLLGGHSGRCGHISGLVVNLDM